VCSYVMQKVTTQTDLRQWFLCENHQFIRTTRAASNHMLVSGLLSTTLVGAYVGA